MKRKETEMRVRKGKKQRLWQKIVVTDGAGKIPTGVTIVDGPIAPDATLGDLTDLDRLLNKIYDPVQFDSVYHWEDVEDKGPAPKDQVRGYEGRRSRG